jgi:hypothetical protein
LDTRALLHIQRPDFNTLNRIDKIGAHEHIGTFFGTFYKLDTASSINRSRRPLIFISTAFAPFAGLSQPLLTLQMKGIHVSRHLYSVFRRLFEGGSGYSTPRPKPPKSRLSSPQRRARLKVKPDKIMCFSVMRYEPYGYASPRLY